MICEANVCSTHLGLLYLCLVQLDAQDLCSQPLETEVHLPKERDDDKLALTQISAHSAFFPRQEQKSEPDRSPSLPSLLIRTDWWGRSPGRAAGVCQPSLSSCVPGRLQTKHSVAREGRGVGVEYERQMDRFIAMVVRCSCRVNCHVPGHKQKGKLFTLMLRWRRVCPVLDNCAFAKQSIIQLLCPLKPRRRFYTTHECFMFFVFLKKRG